MATADVLLVNIWCHDLGREHGAGKPLLRTARRRSVFRCALRQLFRLRGDSSPPQVLQVHLKVTDPRPKKLVFVVRDPTKTPEATLSGLLASDLEKLWSSLPKPERHAAAPVSDFFDVRYEFLPSFEAKPEAFAAAADALALRLTDPASPGALCSQRAAGVPSDSLTESWGAVWVSATTDADLNLPAHRVMVATVRCAAIAKDALADLAVSPQRAALAEADAAAAGAFDAAVAASASTAPPSPPPPPLPSPVPPGGGAAVGALIAAALAKYDAASALQDAGVAGEQRKALHRDAADALRPFVAAWLSRGRAAAADAAKRVLAAHASASSVASGGAAPSTAVSSSAATFSAAAAGARAASAAAWAAARSAAVPTAVPTAPDASSPVPPEWAPQLAAASAKVASDVAAAVSAARSAVLASCLRAATHAATRRLGPAIASLLEAPPPDAWRRLRALVAAEAAAGGEEVSRAAVLAYGGEEADAAASSAAAAEAGRRMASSVAESLRELTCDKAGEAAASVGASMHASFSSSFAHDPSTGLPRAWRPREDVDGAAAGAMAGAAAVLGALTVLRLDPQLDAAGEKAAAEVARFAAPAEPPAARGAESGGGSGGGANAPASASAAAAAAAAAPPAPPHAPPAALRPLLTGSTWEGVPPAATLIPPSSAKALWKGFAADAGFSVSAARAAQEAARRASWLGGPAWMVAAIAILGFNEFTSLLRWAFTPTGIILLSLLAGVFLFGRAVYIRLDVDATVARHGLVPAAAMLMAGVIPAVLATVKQLAEEGAHAAARVQAHAVQAQAQQQQGGAGAGGAKED